MDRIAVDVVAIVREVMATYACAGTLGETYLITNEADSNNRTYLVYGVTYVADSALARRKSEVAVALMVRILGDHWIIIQADYTDHPVEDYLLQHGIAPEQIIRGYLGETVPDHSHWQLRPPPALEKP